MRLMFVGLVVVCSVGAGPAWSINRCVAPNGKVVFQDRPCPGKGERIEVRPASGDAPSAASSPDDKPKMSEAERLNALTDESQRDRRRWELREHLIPSTRMAQDRHRANCERTQRDLQDEQYRYVQNLYGKTHAAQMASEMAAVAARCDTTNRELKAQLDALTAECNSLGCMVKK